MSIAKLRSWRNPMALFRVARATAKLFLVCIKANSALAWFTSAGGHIDLGASSSLVIPLSLVQVLFGLIDCILGYIDQVLGLEDAVEGYFDIQDDGLFGANEILLAGLDILPVELNVIGCTAKIPDCHGRGGPGGKDIRIGVPISIGTSLGTAIAPPPGLLMGEVLKLVVNAV